MSQLADVADPLPRYIVGIDLGTTNCSAAYVDTAEEPWTVRDLAIPQLVAAGTVEARLTLPSSLYEPAAGEFAPGMLRLPWSTEDERWIVGLLAREQGASAPGRLVSSAKSWLSHAGIDRTAGVLPWHAAEDVQRLSPVEASAAYLEHIRKAWDHAHPEHPLAGQDVVLTVPASFDEVARELTVEAAKRAGLVRLTLVEEPQAAFYAWIDAQGPAWQRRVEAGQKILVVDVGGGTTDFTLIRVKPAEGGKVMFHRIAVGQHLILGGDNLDLALAHHIEAKATGGGKLPPRQWSPLVRSARAMKETFLGTAPPPQHTVNVTGGGSKLIGGGMQVTLSAEEARQLLVEGFLPRVGLEEKPAARRSGFGEFNLPYAPDPAITRYLAAFLTAHRESPMDEDNVIRMHHDPARPDLVLLNGGFFESPALRDRLLDVLAGWFARAGAEPWRPTLLENERLDLAVSRGAAAYGAVRRGRGVMIRGGLAHSYYIGVDVADEPVPRAVCLVPAGAEEGHDVRLGRTFNLLIRQPVEFPLYYSATRTTDRPGQLVEIDPEQLTALPAIRTVLQSGRKSAADVVQVHLHARLSAVGTLQLWAEEAKGERQWRLEFDVRSASRAEVARHGGAAEMQGFVDTGVLDPAQELIHAAFSAKAGAKGQLPAPPTPASVVKRLELLTGMSRNEWPASLLRGFWEAMMEVADGRRLSVDHESRWLSFTGFCLRPGYGLAVDDWRVAQVWRLAAQKITHAKNELVRAEWWILWRRIAGGLTAGQQLTLAEPLIAAMKSRLRAAGPIPQSKSSPFQYGAHETAEAWRLLGSLELLRPALKAELGDLALELWPREKSAATGTAALFALGRLGSRVPVYGPLDALVEAEKAEGWADRLMAMEPKQDEQRPQRLFALVQLARFTGDRYRDVGDEARRRVAGFLRDTHASAHYIELVESGGSLEDEEQTLAFGESLPRGLRMD